MHRGDGLLDLYAKSEATVDELGRRLFMEESPLSELLFFVREGS